jgi:hypothetical protein
MDNMFTPVDADQHDDNPLEAIAQKFGVAITPETEKIIRSKADADTYIRQIQRENEELRGKVSSQATVDEIMTQIKAFAPKPTATNEPSQVPQTPSPATPDELESIVSSLLEKKRTEERVRSNQESVKDKLLERWGSDAQNNLNKKAKELNVSLDYLQKIALDSPSAFFALVGLNQTVATPAPVVAPRSHNQMSVQPTGGEKRTQGFYNQLKAKDFKTYISPKVQNQMMKDALTMGESFFDV